MKEKLKKLITELNKNLTHSQKSNLKSKSSGGICDFCLDKRTATLYVPTSYKYLIHPVYSNYTMIGPCCLDKYLDSLVEEKVMYDSLKIMVEVFQKELTTKRNNRKKQVTKDGK